MKKVVLSTVAAALIATVGYADTTDNTITLYSDTKTGQVFTTPADGRVEMGDFIDAQSVDKTQREQASSFSEYLDGQKKYVPITAKAKKLDFSGTHYFGFSSKTYGDVNSTAGDQSAGFETRRNYLQVKAYFNDKDYFRLTMDSEKTLESTPATTVDKVSTSGLNKAPFFLKYAYLYLDDILPSTGVEIGVAHRTWNDYEESNGWLFRPVDKIALESASVVKSADLGVNFQTKTPYFNSEIGLFNGEGYDSSTTQNRASGLDFEWRLTGYLLGNGTEKINPAKDTYANISFAGFINKDKDFNGATTATSSTSRINQTGYWLHAVYNQPLFLVAAQYGKMTQESRSDLTSTNTTNYDINVMSVNAEVRPIEDWSVFGRYETVDTEYDNNAAANTADTGDYTVLQYGAAYNYSKNVRLIASAKDYDSKPSTTTANQADYSLYMLTTEIKW